MDLPPPPSPFGPDDDWLRWRRERRRLLPAWHADRDYVTSIALEQLPRVLAQLEFGEVVAMLPRPGWWPRAILTDRTREIHGLADDETARPIVVLRLDPDGYDLLFVDLVLGAWSVPNLCLAGEDLVSLAAWRWQLGNTKAAWRLARVCGLRKPTP